MSNSSGVAIGIKISYFLPSIYTLLYKSMAKNILTVFLP